MVPSRIFLLNSKPLWSLIVTTMRTGLFKTTSRSWSCKTCVCFALPSNWGSRRVTDRLSLALKNKVDPMLETTLTPLRQSVKEQSDVVTQLEQSGASEIDVKEAVNELNLRRKLLNDQELALAPAKEIFNRMRMEDLLKRRFFFVQSFEIYGGISGQYDFGPTGCAMMSNIINEWRNFFILEEQMLEIESSILTPEPVLKASGHTGRFTDFMVTDMKKGEFFRMDHLIKVHLLQLITEKNISTAKKAQCEDLLIKLDGMKKEEMTAVLREYNIKSPTGNDLSDPSDLNLMFETSVGPTGLVKSFLRPENAQGIFVNFKRLLAFNEGRLPFAAAQIGKSFRNEISPHSGLIRVREFTVAEIEHFVDPCDKGHPKFDHVKDLKVCLYSACSQMDGKIAEHMTIGDAVQEKLIPNETLAYYVARIQMFLVKLGIDPIKLRFRQHMKDEMAHYASDCWDAECLTSYGWLECVGCADRSCYDLLQHSKATGVNLAAEKKLPEPRIIDVVEIKPNKRLFKKIFNDDATTVLALLNDVDNTKALEIEKKLEESGEFHFTFDDKSWTLTKDILTLKKHRKTVQAEEIIPNVIEPSFGIGRIMHVIFEHTFRVREEDDKRTFFSLPPIIAPIKCSILPLSVKPEFQPLMEELSRELTKMGVSHRVIDKRGSIGRRYTRSDEISIPFAITIDFDSLEEPHSVTVRHRDSARQIRAPLLELPSIIKDLSCNKLSWQDVEYVYPKIEQQKTE